jgi:putative ABC transport system permease protein
MLKLRPERSARYGFATAGYKSRELPEALNMHTWTIAGKNLWRRPARSALTACGLAIAVGAVVALVGVSDSLESSFLDLYTRPGADLVVQRRGGAEQLSKGIPLTFGDQIRAIPGVHDIVSGLMDMISFEDHDLFMVIVNGWEPDSLVLDRVRVTSGRRLRIGDRRHVMLGRILAANLGKKSGDRVSLYGQEFEVIGIFESFSVYENGAVFMLLDELQRQMDRPGEVTGFVVMTKTRQPASIARVREQIEALNPDVAATPCAEFVSSLTQMKVSRAMSWFTSLFAVVIGGVGMMNTMAMSVLERKAEIASLRVMGWRKARIARLILSESFLLSILGAAIGVLLGIGVTLLLTHWSKTSGLVQGDLSLWAIGEGLGVALLIAMIGAAYPALSCVLLPIADTLRSS